MTDETKPITDAQYYLGYLHVAQTIKRDMLCLIDGDFDIQSEPMRKAYNKVCAMIDHAMNVLANMEGGHQ